MDMNEMLKQAQSMQAEMQKTKAEIEASIFTSGESRAVVIKMYGSKVIKEVEIKDEAMADKEILQDLIAIASNDCISQINDFTEEKLSKIAPGLGGML